MRRFAAVLLALAVAAGCAASPAASPAWQSCAAASRTEPVPLPHDFRPVSAVFCLTTQQHRTSDGTETVATETRAGDVTALAAALRLPSEKPTSGSCTMELVTLPWFALLDADARWIRPEVPVDACRKPRIEVRAALDHLHPVTISSRPLPPDRVATTGCGRTWTDLVWVTGRTTGGRFDVPGNLAAAAAPVTRCVFRVPPAERGGDKPTGQFESGGQLPAGTWVTARRELAASPPASPCRTPATRFAVLHTPTGPIYVEADGCRRTLINDVALRQATPKLISLLFP
jgi:hypothetical protein